MFFLLPLCVCFAVVICEPICTQFAYQEQLLEKVIDIKYHMDIFSNKMDKWEKIMSEKIDSFGTIKEELDQKVNDVQVFFNKSMDIISKEIEDEKKRQVEDPDVRFKARSVKDQSPSKGDTIVFQTVVQNEGGGYNKDTGTFTAPVSGTYLFTTQFCLHSAKELGVTIIVDGEIITAATFGDLKWTSLCTSTDGIARVQKGDTVKVNVAYASSGTVIYPDRSSSWSYFSGVLIRK